MNTSCINLKIAIQPRIVRKLHPRRFVVDSARLPLHLIVAALFGWLEREQRDVIEFRRECLDHVIVVNATGLHQILTAHVTYYMQSRTHLALQKDAPISRPVMPAAVGRIIVTPHVGGLHHRYDRAAA